MASSPGVSVAIVLAGFIVAGALYLSMGGPWPPFTLWGTRHGNPSLVRPVGSDDHILGNPAAPVMIVEYCDFNSDFCKGYSATLNELIATEGAEGQVAWVYREFPLTELYDTSLAHARAAECAAQVGGNDTFWRFADLLYQNQPVKPSEYGALSEKAGLTGKGFATCYADAANQVDARITADRANALDVGASGAPYSLLLTRTSAGWRTPVVLDGAYTYDALKEVVGETLTPN